jgi:hypothetical protein
MAGIWTRLGERVGIRRPATGISGGSDK